MSLSIRNLETFIWVARLGSFTAAAQRLHSSQPAISMRIRDLEDALGVNLLDRSTNGVRLTPAGRTCVDYTEQLLALHAELRCQVGDANTLVGTIKLGTSEAIALSWLPKLISRLDVQYPQIRVELDVDVNAALWRKFSKGDLDCMLIPGPFHYDNVAFEFLGELHFNWMASPTTAIPDGQLTPKELSELSIVTLSHEANLYQIIHDWFANSHAQPKRYCLCNSLNVVAALTKYGIGIALLPEILIMKEIEQHTLIRLRVSNTPVRMKYFCVYPARSANAASKVIATLAKHSSTFSFPQKK